MTYSTAWYLCHRIREALNEDDDEDGPAPLLRGIVNVNETWVGGKDVGGGRGSTANKHMVAGAVQRDGKARMDVLPNRTRKALHGFIRRHVADDAEAIYTDAWRAMTGSKTAIRSMRA